MLIKTLLTPRSSSFFCVNSRSFPKLIQGLKLRGDGRLGLPQISDGSPKMFWFLTFYTQHLWGYHLKMQLGPLGKILISSPVISEIL